MKRKHVINDDADLKVISEKLAPKLSNIPAERWERQGNNKKGSIKTTLDNGVNIEISAHKYKSGCPAGSGDSIWRTDHTLKVNDDSSEFIIEETDALTRVSNERYARGEETLYPARTYERIMSEYREKQKDEVRKTDQKSESDLKGLLDKL